MSTLFVSVDVETTGPSPVVADLLTLGACAVTEGGEVLESSALYLRLHYDRAKRWDKATHTWWEQQDETVRHEAYGNNRTGLQPTMLPKDAALVLSGWLTQHQVKQQAEDLCFVAHPAGFDWQFVNALCWEHLGSNPFGYRSLCLRSMGFGLSDRPWGEDRTDDSDLYVPSKVPHHALHDAVAQAHQLSRMLKLRGAP